MTRFDDIEPIFVLGAPRSGTTLLQLILNAHPAIGMLSEIHYFNQVLQLQKTIPDLKSVESRRRLFSEIYRVKQFTYLPGAEKLLEGVQNSLAAKENPDYAHFFRYLLEECMRRSGARRCGEKTPQNIRYLRELKEIFPQSKIVHIVRDPRDVVTSLRGMPWAPDGILMNTLKWKIDMLYMHEFLHEGNEVFELRYEDLVTDPDTVLRALCAHIGESFDRKMYEFNRSAGANIKDEPWKEGTHHELNAENTGKWRRGLSTRETKLVEILARPFLVHYGYEEAFGPLRDRTGISVQLFLELWRYLKGRAAEQRRRHSEAPGMIYGDESRIRSKLIRALTIRQI